MYQKQFLAYIMIKIRFINFKLTLQCCQSNLSTPEHILVNTFLHADWITWLKVIWQQLKCELNSEQTSLTKDKFLNCALDLNRFRTVSIQELFYYLLCWQYFVYRLTVRPFTDTVFVLEPKLKEKFPKFHFPDQKSFPRRRCMKIHIYFVHIFWQ